MLLFAGYSAYKWYHIGLIFYGLLFLRHLLLVFFLLTRKQNLEKQSSIKEKVLAYFSSLVPLLYISSVDKIPLFDELRVFIPLFSIIGFTIATVAVLDLGTSFGVSPGTRDYVKTGLYKYLKHPMYIGYSIAELGMILIHPLNIIIYIISMSLYLIRAKREEKYLMQEVSV